MAVMMITFELNTPGQDYSPIFEFIRNMNVWAKITDSCYAVSTHLSPQELLVELRPHLTRNDSLYVLTLQGPWIGFGPDDVNEWLRERLG